MPRPDDAGAPPSRPEGPRQWLSFSKVAPLLLGAIVGITLRLMYFGDPGSRLSPMYGAFIYLVPVAVGAATVYEAERRHRRGWGYYVWAPVAANALVVLGAMATLLEGLICAVVIFPLFAVLGAVGGLAMGLIVRSTKWPRQTLYSIGVLPLLLSALPIDESGTREIAASERSRVIDAPAQQVWQQILNAPDIAPEEVGHAWLYQIGVPLPIAGVTEATASGLVRTVTMGKSIRFKQVSNQWLENSHVRWTYQFAEDSFPPGAMDDHVRIGGHYFDLIDTTYSLRQLENNSTEVRIRMTYRVTTHFNWYADAVAQLLIGNFEEMILNFYGQRATTSLSP